MGEPKRAGRERRQVPRRRRGVPPFAALIAAFALAALGLELKRGRERPASGTGDRAGAFR